MTPLSTGYRAITRHDECPFQHTDSLTPKSDDAEICASGSSASLSGSESVEDEGSSQDLKTRTLRRRTSAALEQLSADFASLRQRQQETHRRADAVLKEAYAFLRSDGHAISGVSPTEISASDCQEPLDVSRQHPSLQSSWRESPSLDDPQRASDTTLWNRGLSAASESDGPEQSRAVPLDQIAHGFQRIPHSRSAAELQVGESPLHAPSTASFVSTVGHEANPQLGAAALSELQSQFSAGTLVGSAVSQMPELEAPHAAWKASASRDASLSQNVEEASSPRSFSELGLVQRDEGPNPEPAAPVASQPTLRLISRGWNALCGFIGSLWAWITRLLGRMPAQ
jgi:hypothetical protein